MTVNHQKCMSGYKLTRLALVFIFAILLTFISVEADPIKTNYVQDPFECSDVALMFARGSGQNALFGKNASNYTIPEFEGAEAQSFQFFKRSAEYIDIFYPNVKYKTVTIHNFPGKYSDVGYQAKGVGLNNLANTINADISWFPGDYRSSVDEGIKETVGYLQEQMQTCPDQGYIVGGYSQGAQVMGESLFKLTEQEQQKILAVGLYGDPKYIGANDSFLNPFDKPSSYPWRRGDAKTHQGGSLDARKPYLPESLQLRAVSHCVRTDIICAGLKAKTQSSFYDHSNAYQSLAMQETVPELLQWAREHLANAERKRGGMTSEQYAAAQELREKSRKIDLMLMVNDGTDPSVLRSLIGDIDVYLHPLLKQYPDLKIGIKAFGEGYTNPTNMPRIDNVMAFNTYYGFDPTRPSTTRSNLVSYTSTRWPGGGQPHFSSGDFADPTALAIERGVFAGGWRDDAEKHMIVISDRPPKEDISFNICHASVRSLLKLPQNGNDACYNNIGSDVWPRELHSEVCETVYHVITNLNCTNPTKSPTYVTYIKRSFVDGIIAANNRNVSVSTVLPYKVHVPMGGTYPEAKQVRLMRDIANGTGGKFIYYDQIQTYRYTKPLLVDTISQVLNHEPKIISAGPPLEQNSTQVLGVSTGKTTVLSAKVQAEEYSWDYNNDGTWDETSQSPTVEHDFSSYTNQFVKVAAFSDDQLVAEKYLAISYEPADPITNVELSNLSAQMTSNETLRLAWRQTTGQLVVFDQDKNVLAILDASDGQQEITVQQAVNSITAQLLTEDAASDELTATVEQYTPPEPAPDQESGPPVSEEPLPMPEITVRPTDPPISQNPEYQEVACIKLQNCVNENAPMPIVQPVASVTQQPQINQGPLLVSIEQSQLRFGLTNVDEPQVAAATTSGPQTLQSLPQTMASNSVPVANSAPIKYTYIVVVILLAVMATLLKLSVSKAVVKPPNTKN